MGDLIPMDKETCIVSVHQGFMTFISAFGLPQNFRYLCRMNSTP